MGETAAKVEQANEALVRRAFDAWNANNWDGLEAVYDPKVVAVAPEGFLEAGERRGWPELREEYERLKGTWREETIEVLELVSRADQVAALVRWAGVGKASGASSSVEVSNLVTIHAGRITRLEYCWTLDDATAAMSGSEAGAG